MINNKNKEFRADNLANEILGKLDAHDKMVSLNVLAYVVRNYIVERYGFKELEATTDRLCNMIKAS